MCLTEFCWFTPVLSNENLVSPNVLILTACDELKDEVFLNGQSKFPHFLSLNKLSKQPSWIRDKWFSQQSQAANKR